MSARHARLLAFAAMAIRPVGREEALQHLFVLAICAFLIISPYFLVDLWKLRDSLVGLGIFFAVIDLVVAANLRRPRPGPKF